MKIVHISSADNKGGGARSVFRLHQSLRKLAIDSSMFVRSKFSDDPSIVHFQRTKRSPLQKLVFRLKRKVETQGRGYFFNENSLYNGFAPAASPLGNEPFKQLPEADIVTLNWVSGFWDYSLLKELPSKSRKAVWRLSDMNPFTGGCFYDASCGKFKDECGNCPCLESDTSNDLSQRNLRKKRAVIEALPDGFLHIVAQSKWIAEEIKSSHIMKGLSVTHIPNGIDESAYRPIDRLEARKKLGIEPSRKVVMFIAQSLMSPRKGATYFIEALKRLPESELQQMTVLAVGQDEFPSIEHAEIKQISNVESAADLSNCYSAADLYAITSLQDNLPNTVLEALSCGTPVVGFDIGGIPDMVKSGETGELVPIYNTEALASAMIGLLSNNTVLGEMSVKARQTVLDNYTIAKQTQTYIDFYRSLLQA